MTKFLLIIFLIYQKQTLNDRLPSFPNMSQSIFPKQDLRYPKVKKIVFLSSSFEEDGPNTKLKFDFYFDNDKIITARFLNFRNDSAYNTISFDKFSRITNQINSASNPIKEIRYSYDEEHFTSTELQFPKNKVIFKKTEVHYDKQYQPIKKLVFAGDTSLIAYWLYKYNDNGDLIEERFVNKFKTITTIPRSDLAICFEELSRSPDYLTTYSVFYDNLKRPLTKMEYCNSRKKSRTEYFYSNDSTTIKTTTYFLFNNNLYPRRINITTVHDSIKIVKDLNLNIHDSTIIDSELKFLYVNNEVRENFQRGPHYNFKYSIRT